MAAAPKRSLFNKPKWATSTPAASSTSTENEFYRHSDRVYKDILAENERRRQENSENKSENEHKSDDYSRLVKRRRLSQEDHEGDSRRIVDNNGLEDDDDGSGSFIGSARRPDDSQSQPKTRSKGRVDPLVEASPVKPISRDRGKDSSQPQAMIIELNEEEGETDPASSKSPPKPKPALVEVPSDDSDSDEYVRELKRKAREKRRQQLLDRSRTSMTPDVSRPSSSHSQGLQPSTNSESTTAPHPPPTDDDPICKLLITSPIPGTTPLIVERRASQRLQEVRQYWCQRQGFSPDFSRTVFLTWRSHRLYDISTCKSLSDKADRHSSSRSFSNSNDKSSGGGNDDDDEFLFSPSSSQQSFFEKSKGQIAIEAMTEDLLQEAKRRDQHGNSRRGHQTSSSSSATDHTQPHDTNTNTTTTGPHPPNEPPPPPREPDIRLLLRAAKLEPLKLKVRPSTPVWKVIAAFKDQRMKASGSSTEAGQQQQVTLMFDGEMLDPEATMGSTGVEDTDAVDVVIR